MTLHRLFEKLHTHGRRQGSIVLRVYKLIILVVLNKSCTLFLRISAVLYCSHSSSSSCVKSSPQNHDSNRLHRRSRRCRCPRTQARETNQTCLTKVSLLFSSRKLKQGQVFNSLLGQSMHLRSLSY